MLKLPVEFKSKFAKVLEPPVLLSLKVPFIEVKPLTFKITLPIEIEAPATTVIGPETIKLPVTVPVMELPLFKTNPPAPTLVVRTEDQLAIPFIVSDKHVPGAPFIVTVLPEHIITLSAAPGIVAEAAPEQDTVDQVEGEFQLPFTREK